MGVGGIHTRRFRGDVEFLTFLLSTNEARALINIKLRRAHRRLLDKFPLAGRRLFWRLGRLASALLILDALPKTKLMPVEK